jgi:hypothetical protein
MTLAGHCAVFGSWRECLCKMSYSGTAFENKYGRKIDVLPVKKWQDGLHPQVTFCKVNIVSGEGKFLPDERYVGGFARWKEKKESTAEGASCSTPPDIVGVGL